jgi:hypothetical protein
VLVSMFTARRLEWPWYVRQVVAGGLHTYIHFTFYIYFLNAGIRRPVP